MGFAAHRWTNHEKKAHLEKANLERRKLRRDPVPGSFDKVILIYYVALRGRE
jgi:hypothetical protein